MTQFLLGKEQYYAAGHKMQLRYKTDQAANSVRKDWNLRYPAARSYVLIPDGLPIHLIRGAIPNNDRDVRAEH